MFNYAELNKDTMAQEYRILKCHKKRFPRKYKQWMYPAAWIRGVNIEQHIDVPMHLLFLGVVKTTVK
jgi:hypothetical protein